MIHATMTSNQIGRLTPSETLVLLPVGSMEQHSDHLATGTDAIVADAIAREVERRMPDTILLLPTIRYGASNHHEGRAGTISTGSDVLVSMIEALVCSAHRSGGFNRFAILNGHGGNVAALRLAIERVVSRAPGLDIVAFSYWDAMFAELDARQVTTPEGIGHAGHVETSIILHLDPLLVDDGAMRDDKGRLHPPAWLATGHGFAETTAHGGVGDPTGATPEAGHEYYEAAVAGSLAVIRALPLKRTA